MTSSPVAKVENGGDGESKIHSSLTILTAGVKGYSIPVNPEVERTKDGKIILNEFCQIDRYPNVFRLAT